MKLILKLFFCICVCTTLTNCSNDDQTQKPEVENQEPPNMVDTPNTLEVKGAVIISGYPKSIKKYIAGKLEYWENYYFNSDKKLLKVRYSYPQSSSSEVFSIDYYYNTNGKLEFLKGWDDYKFIWDNNRIVKTEFENIAWNGKSEILYTYNKEGQITETTENNLDFNYGSKSEYSYHEDGNLKSIKLYYTDDYRKGKTYELYTVTNFASYSSASNLFYEFVIIPWQIAQPQFPVSEEFKHLRSSGYDTYYVYDYKYDDKSRVIEKSYGNTRIVYEYY